jgi:Carboxypeptidase regulatory-like domain
VRKIVAVTGLLLLTPFCATAQNALPAAPQAAMASVTGVVLDPAGSLVQNGHVALTAKNEARTETETTTAADGVFNFSSVVPGDYTLTITAPGFAPRVQALSLAPGQAYQAPDLVLTVATAAQQVEVSVSPEQMQQFEVNMEVHQRVLGVVPNFYVAYEPNPLPLKAKYKFEIAMRQVFDPVSIIGTGFTAGLHEATGVFKGYGGGAEGYGARYGAVMADSVSGALIGNALLPIVLHQDPRYFYKGTGTKRERFWYAILFTVRCKGDNGQWQPNYSGILGGMASGGISNLYYPAADRNGVALTFENTGFGILGGAIGNLFQEFLVKKLTPHVPDYKSGH